MKKRIRRPTDLPLRVPGNQKGARQIERGAPGGIGGAKHGKGHRSGLRRVCRVPPNVVNLGFAGYKQPQQLLALAYFLSLGAEYDLMINLDGYNDIVLPFTDNYNVGVNPFFPRNWNLRISRQPSKKILAVIGKVRYLRDLKEENLEGLTSSLFRGSAVFGLMKMQQFKRLNWDINRSRQIDEIAAGRSQKIRRNRTIL